MAPLLAACGTEASGGGGTGDGKIPICASGQALTTNSTGAIICKALPPGTVSLPTCDQSTGAVTSTVTGMSCTTRNNGAADDPALVTRINNAENTINTLETKLGTIGATPAAVRTWVGNTTATSKGDMSGIPAADNSLLAAANACKAQYGDGARMCTVRDVYTSAVKGVIGSAKNIAKSWIYAPSWNNPITGSQDANSGMGDTCGSYTYPTGDRAWTGVAVETGTLNTTKWGVRFRGGTDAACSLTLPIACCK